jgi:hypothetical protein
MQIQRTLYPNPGQPSQPPVIICDDSTDFRNTQWVLPGHKITLDMLFVGSFQSIAGQGWDIKGRKFSSWVVSSDSSMGTLNQDVDVSGTEVNFYWADFGYYNVTAHADIVHSNGETHRHTAWVEFLVVQPEWTFETTIAGTVKHFIDDDHVGAIGLVDTEHHATNPERYGIQYTNINVTIPSLYGFEQGTIELVQLVASRFLGRKSHVINECEEVANDPPSEADQFLDTFYPLFPQAPEVWSTGAGNVYNDGGDLPEMPVSGYDQSKARVVCDTFLMFLPGQTQSQWVPLTKIHWATSWCATRIPNPEPGGPSWAFAYPNTPPWAIAQPPVQADGPPPVHPQWTSIADDTYSSGVCEDCITGTEF